jgi:hypothetical protein
VHDAVLVDVVRLENELVLLALGPEPLALAERDRVDEEVDLVDEPVADEAADQLAAAGDVDDAVALLLEAADRVGVVRADRGRVRPLLGRLVRPDDKLLGLVEERRSRTRRSSWATRRLRRRR